MALALSFLKCNQKVYIQEMKSMRKTLSDVAIYLKSIIPPDTRKQYTISPEFLVTADGKSIQDGVHAFRAFLFRLYDVLNAEGDAHDTSKKVAHEYENRIGLSVYFPFLYNVKTLLMKIGYHGVLSDSAQLLSCGGDIFDERISVTKSLECLRFLLDCGIFIDGLDPSNKKQSLSDVETIKVSYPDNPAMLVGLKVMAIAEIDHGTLVNQDIFMRCDYRVLKKEDTPIVSIVKDTISPLPGDVQKFLLWLHQRYLAQGLTCAVEIKGFHIYIRYCYKRKDVWGINASLNNGYHINVKSVKTQEYEDVIKTFPLFLQDSIAKGYGCGRKREIGHCDGGCRGIPIPLDGSVLDIQNDIVEWFDREVSCLRKK